jgi:hypothetical protein
MWSDSIWDSIIIGLILFGLICFVLGVGVVWGLPKLWIIIKPIIHAITA